MEFLEYMSYADYFVDQLWVSLLVGGLCFAIVYVFKAVGLFTIAVREGYKNKWMAFVPFLNTYYIGVCGQKNKFLNFDTKKLAIVVAVLEFVLFSVFILSEVAFYLVRPYLLTVEEDPETISELILGSSSYPYLPKGFGLDYPELAWAAWCFNYLDYILYPIEIIYRLGLLAVITCFFQTYSTRHYLLFTLASIFVPVQGILIFAVKNNKGMSYAEYVRKMQESMYRQYRSQQNNPYNNPYSGGYNNPHQNGQPPYGGQGSAPEDPFSEYGNNSNSSDPFDEFKN